MHEILRTALIAIVAVALAKALLPKVPVLGQLAAYL
jgi:hypothetical protein